MRRSLLLLLSLPVLNAAIGQQKWDLRKCVQYALDNNISVKQSDIQARISAITYKQNKLAVYPTANFGFNTGEQFGRSIDPTTNSFINTQLLYTSASLQSGATLFNWFQLKNSIAAAKYDLKTAEVSLEKLKNDISLNVAAAYLQVLSAKAQSEISKAQLALTRNQLNLTRKQVDAGSLPELNAAELEAQYATDTANYIAAQSTYEQNILQLKAVINVDMAAPFEIEAPAADQIPVEALAELEPEVVYNLAIKNLPQSKVNEFRLLAAEKRLQSVKGSLYPNISLFGSVQTNSTDKARDILTGDKLGFFKQYDQNFRQSVGLSLQVPIFNGWQSRANVERSRLTMQNTKLQNEQDNVTLKKDIYSAYQSAMSAMNTYNANKKALSTAEYSYDLSKKRYDAGLSNTLQYITNQNNLTLARIRLVQSQFDYIFKLKVLEFYKGTPVKL